MDHENKPNMKRTRIGGGYMVVGYGSGGRLWQRWWYVVAVVGYGSSGGMAAAMNMVRRRRDKL
jgi:hypothetical protein